MKDLIYLLRLFLFSLSGLSRDNKELFILYLLSLVIMIFLSLIGSIFFGLFFSVMLLVRKKYRTVLFFWFFFLLSWDLALTVSLIYFEGPIYADPSIFNMDSELFDALVNDMLKLEKDVVTPKSLELLVYILRDIKSPFLSRFCIESYCIFLFISLKLGMGIFIPCLFKGFIKTLIRFFSGWW